MYFFFFNDTATTEIYTLSLHDALPISLGALGAPNKPRVGSVLVMSTELDFATGYAAPWGPTVDDAMRGLQTVHGRSEEHTSELQSRQYLVCRLLLEKKKKH